MHAARTRHPADSPGPVREDVSAAKVGLGATLFRARQQVNSLTRIFRRSTTPSAPNQREPSQAALFVDRLEGLSQRGRTLGYLLQACILRLDMVLKPQDHVPQPETATTIAAYALRARRERQHPGLSTSRRVLPLGLMLTMLAPGLLLAAGFAAYEVYASYVHDLVPPEQMALNQPSRGARIYDRNGELLYEFISERDGVRLPVKLEDVSPAFIAVTIATEDDTFFTNPGVNPRGLMRAAWENVKPVLDRGEDGALVGSGGSSITQQLVKNVYIPSSQRSDRSFDRKLREATYALELTQRYDKRQILEWYVNQISYGGRYNGVEAASQGYFGKSARDLSLAEAALLAGIPQSPARYDPFSRPDIALSRRSEILDILSRHDRIQVGDSAFFNVLEDDVEAARREPLTVLPRTFPIEAPHFILNHVAPELEALLGRDALYRDGLVVMTSLDMNLQRQAQDNLERWIEEFEDISNSRNGALTVIDAHTGELLSLIGSRDYFREDIQGNVDNLTALNSPGSTFKPFVYLASFLRLGWNAQTMVDDAPISVRESDGRTFQPQNPNRGTYLGSIPIAKALGNSLNVPAFRTAMRLGVPSIVEVAKQAGFTTLNGSYGPAIAIGGVDLTAMDLTYGYSVLANNGLMVGENSVMPRKLGERNIDPISILKVEDSSGTVRFDVSQRRAQKQVVQATKAYEVTSILSDPANQCVTFGCGGIRIPGRIAAVKTGTSEPFDPSGPNAGKIGETWAFGYTPDYVVGVWAGNSDNSPVVNIFSTSISYRVMRDTLQAAYGGRTSSAFVRPAQVVQPTPPSRATVQARLTAEVAGARIIATRSPSPTSKAAISGITPIGSGYVITGSAYSGALESYRVELAPMNSTAWRSVAQGRTGVPGGKLGEIGSGSVPPGNYNVRIVVQDAKEGTIVSEPMRASIR